MLIIFWRSLDLSLINCAIYKQSDMSLTKNFIITVISATAPVAGNPDANPPFPGQAEREKSNILFQRNSVKLCPGINIDLK